MMKLPPIIPLISRMHREDIPLVAGLLKQHQFTHVEITFRSESTLELLETFSKQEDMVIGAGTVTDLKQLKSAITCGAKFIISPGFDEEIVSYCLENKIKVYPGVLTPTEIQKAKSLGLHTLKLFPGGLFEPSKLLKAYYGPFKDMDFIVTGGISLKNYLEYLKQPNVVSVSGSFILNPEDLRKRDMETLSKTLERIHYEIKTSLPR